jgi:hypothetical protein
MKGIEEAAVGAGQTTCRRAERRKRKRRVGIDTPKCGFKLHWQCTASFASQIAASEADFNAGATFL